MRIIGVTPVKCQYIPIYIIIINIYRTDSSVRKVSGVSENTVYINNNNSMSGYTDNTDTKLTPLSEY
jgi:hypothetical protein